MFPVPCRLKRYAPRPVGRGAIRGSTHFLRLRRTLAAANGCLRGRLLVPHSPRPPCGRGARGGGPFGGRLTGGVRCGSGPARSQSGLASLFAVPRLLVPVCAFAYPWWAIVDSNH